MGLRLNTTNKSEGRKEKLIFRKCNSYQQTWYEGEKTNLGKRSDVEGSPAAAHQ